MLVDFIVQRRSIYSHVQRVLSLPREGECPWSCSYRSLLTHIASPSPSVPFPFPSQLSRRILWDPSFPSRGLNRNLRKTPQNHQIFTRLPSVNNDQMDEFLMCSISLWIVWVKRRTNKEFTKDNQQRRLVKETRGENKQERQQKKHRERRAVKNKNHPENSVWTKNK